MVINENEPMDFEDQLNKNQAASFAPDSRRRPAASSGTDDLPMVVWLRGDEPWCEEFHLDADAVMEQLGIKRSRLTQISGRELRVGRMRMGRYIRPFYRQQDVNAYREWTRPTASHLRSSRVLNEAAGRLEDHVATLSHQMTRLFSSLSQKLGERIDRLVSYQERDTGKVRLGQKRLLRELERQDGRLARLLELVQPLGEAATLLPWLKHAQTTTSKEVFEISTTVRELKQLLDRSTQSQTSRQEELTQRLERLEQRTEDLGSKLWMPRVPGRFHGARGAHGLRRAQVLQRLALKEKAWTPATGDVGTLAATRRLKLRQRRPSNSKLNNKFRRF